MQSVITMFRREGEGWEGGREEGRGREGGREGGSLTLGTLVLQIQ